MAETSIWGAVEYLVPRLSSSTRIPIRATGEKLSILFDEAQVTLDAKRDGFDSWWTASLAVPVKTGGSTKFMCELRGFIRKTTGARAVLIASVGGQLTTRDYGYGSEVDEKIEIELNFDASSLSAGRVVIVLMLHAERQSFDHTAMLVLDSADAFTIAPAKET